MFSVQINKAQGQTLRVVGVYLPDPVFTHGLLYVALSRVGDPQHLTVCILPVDKFQGIDADGKTFTCNIVYDEVLLPTPPPNV